MAEPREAQSSGEPDISAEVLGLSAFDPQALAHVVTGAEFEHRKLPGGGSGINLLQCCLPHSVINRGSYAPAVLVNGTFAPNAITIGTMLKQQEATILNGSNVRMGTVQLYAEKSEMCYRAFPNATWFAFVIPRERLLQFCVDHLDNAPALPGSGISTFEPRTKESGDQLLERLRDLDRSLRSLSLLQNASRLGESVENDLLARLANFMSAKPLVRRTNDPRRLRLCSEILRNTIKLVESNPDEMLDLRSMSKATGLSPRTLQRTFQTEYGLCPQEWLRVERLNRVREELLDTRFDTSVTDAATRWGFFHLGRFSQYYRQLFGERPSQTMLAASHRNRCGKLTRPGQAGSKHRSFAFRL
jgi:AraC family transcriptional regulator, ethanolamine operon transcriptional activator